MKKKSMLRRVLAMMLVLVMTMSLAACNKPDGTTDGGSAKPDANSELAKQYVFGHQVLDLGVEMDDMNILTVAPMDNRVYMVAEIYNWSSMSDERNIMLVSMDLQGGDMQNVPLELPDDTEDSEGKAVDEDSVAEDVEVDDVTVEEETTEDIAENEAATMDILTNNVMIGIDDNFGVEDPFYNEDTGYEYTGYDSFTFTKDGHLYGMKTHTREDWSDPENYISESTRSICRWGMDGKILWEKPVPDFGSEDEWLYVEQIVGLEDGSLVLLIGGDKYYKMDVDAEGNTSDMKPLNGMGDKVANINQMMYKGEGQFLLTYYDTEWTKMYMATYDIKADTMGPETELPQSFMIGGFSSMTAGISTDLVYTNSNGVYGMSANDLEAKQIMSFINSDLSVNYMDRVVMLDDEHFVGVYSDELNDYRTTAALFTKKNPEDILDKAVLVLAAFYVNSEIRKHVVDFNQSNDAYRIVIKSYEEYATEDDYLAGYTQLNNDIISGNMPDILVCGTSSELPVENYISKGLLADVGELMSKDPEISQIAYVQNVFDAYKVKDKLYHIIPGFMVRTVIGKESNVGNRTAWTFEDLQKVMSDMPEGTQAFGEMTRDSFIYSMMSYCGNDFIDPATGKCEFDSPNFISMLEFAATLPQEISYEDKEYWETYWDNYQSQYRENRTLLMESYIGSVKDLNYTINGHFGGDVSFVGFPTESGSGSVLYCSDNALLLSAKSKNLEGAWEFARYYLTEEYQGSDDIWTMPTIKSIFDEKAAMALEKPYYIDEEGNKVEYDDYFDMNGESIPLEPMTQEQLDKVVALIESVDKVMYYNDDIQNIISEEAASFFDGQKSAAEVAQIIQSRAQIYVDENR